MTARGDRWLKLGVVGAVLTCIACFTPAAVALLGFLGLAVWTGYLDYVLWPLLAALLIFLAWRLWYRRRHRGPDGTGLPNQVGPAITARTASLRASQIGGTGGTPRRRPEEPPAP